MVEVLEGGERLEEDGGMESKCRDVLGGRVVVVVLGCA